jgi:L-amino acid N-acyltransferase YncA
VRLRAATSADAAAIAAIYAPFVTDSPVSFETAPPTAEDMRARIEAGGDLYPWIVAADEQDVILGYAYATAFRARPAYRYVVETSVYLGRGEQGRGIGTRLYHSLLATLEAQGFTQAIAAITLPNPGSVALHERLGFAAAGVYRQVGYKMGEWLDVGLWQRPLGPATNPPVEPKPIAAVGLQLL